MTGPDRAATNHQADPAEGVPGRCPACGQVHPTPGPRRSALAWPLGDQRPLADPRQQTPSGWGRNRGGDCW